MLDYSKMSRKELRTNLNSAPPETPHYLRAKEELERRQANDSLGAGIALSVVTLIKR